MARMTPAVNVMFGYLAAQDPPPPAQVIRSLETPASRAHNRFQAGVSEVSVREQWPSVFVLSQPGALTSLRESVLDGNCLCSPGQGQKASESARATDVDVESGWGRRRLFFDVDENHCCSPR